MSNHGLDVSQLDERRTLWIVLAINLALTAGFGIGGVIGDSSSLLANALDNAADSMVFVLSLVAMKHGMGRKIAAARASGYLSNNQCQAATDVRFGWKADIVWRHSTMGPKPTRLRSRGPK